MERTTQLTILSEKNLSDYRSWLKDIREKVRAEKGRLTEAHLVESNGQELCTHEDALTQVAHCGPCRFGQSEIYSARPVMDSFEQARMHTVPTT